MNVPVKDGKIQITCPYCFEEFAHDEVCFRLESWYDIDSRDPEHMLDPAGEGRTAEEIRDDKDTPEAKRKEDYDEYRKRERYSKGQSEQYRAFWSKYTVTTETATSEEENIGLKPWERPVRPASALKNHVTIMCQGPFDDLDSPPLPFLLKATDECGKNGDGRETKRRVCPRCHNPLSGNYGLNPIHFISVIGAGGSGKTVYIAQLLKNLNRYTSKAEITAGCSNCGKYVKEYVEKNSVEMHKPVPNPTQPKDLVQPMIYQLDQMKHGRRYTSMVVFYDIAGENVEGNEGNTDGIEKFGHFIFHSHAIMILIGPESFVRKADGGVDKVDTQTVVTVIGQNYLTLSGENTRSGLINKPVAICLSKADKPGIRDAMLDGNALEKIDDDRYTPDMFDAESYNPIQKTLARYFAAEQKQLVTALKNLYSNYNFFAFTAQGVDIMEMEIDGTYHTVLKGRPSPKRIEEPFMWILHKLGYIGTNTRINEPPHKAPETWTCQKCGAKHQMSTRFCKHVFKKYPRPENENAN